MSSATPIPNSASVDNGGWLFFPGYNSGMTNSDLNSGLSGADIGTGAQSYIRLPLLNPKAVVIDEVVVNVVTKAASAVNMRLVKSGSFTNGAKTAPSGAPAAANCVTEYVDLNTLTNGVGARVAIHPTTGDRNHNVIEPYGNLYLYFSEDPAATSLAGLQIAIRWREQR